MNTGLREFAEEYASALGGFLKAQGEPGLQRAYELGRKAVASRLGVLDIAWAHQEAITLVLESITSRGETFTLGKLSSVFLLESLAAIEMTYKGFQEVVGTLSKRTIELAASNKMLETEIRERKEVEQALQRSEDLFRSLVENASDVITILNPDGTVRYESPSLERVLGYRENDLLGKMVFDYVHPGDAPELFEVFRKGLEIPGFTISRAVRFRHKDGTWRILESVGKNLMSVPGISGVLVSSRDITEKLHLQEQLDEAAKQRERDARLVAVRVQTAQEEERQRIARELHDDICQRLSAMRLQINLAEENMTAIGPAARKSLRSVKHQVDTLITDVRRISANLRPAALDLFGLVTSLRILCEGVEKTYGIRVAFEANGEAGAKFEEQTEIALYRIAQEALNNAVRHSDAETITLNLEGDADVIILGVRDNGKGFIAETGQDSTSLTNGYGLISMRERAELLGGTFQLESEKNEGTTVLVKIPVVTR